MNYYSYILLLLCFVLQHNHVFSNNLSNEETKVLLLNSYHKGFYWTDEITHGVEDVLASEIDELHIEYMDTKRQFNDEYRKLLSTILKYKINKHNYKLVITSDNNAFNFLKKNKQQLIGDIPVIFCGVNYIQKDDLYGLDRVTGVNENANIEGNLHLIKRIHKGVKEVIVITDNTATGKRLQAEVNRLKSSFSDLDIKLLFNVTATELVDSVRNIDIHSVILYTLFFRDKDDVFFEYDKGASMVCDNANVPVYGTWDFSLGYGVVGGYLTNGYEQGEKAAKKALQYLKGEQIINIPILYDSPNKAFFDYAILKKYEIDQSKLPKDVTIINQPKSFFYKNKALLKNVAILFLFLVLIIIGLFYGFIRSLKLKRQLNESKIQLSSLITNLPGVVYRCVAESKWKMIYLSDNIHKICGYESIEFLGQHKKPIASIIYNQDLPKVKVGIDKALAENKSWEITYRVVHKNGDFRWVTEYGRGIKNEEGKYEYLDGLILEITKRKLAEDKLKNSELRFKNIFENSPLGTFYYDINGVIIDCNENFAQILGTKKENLVGFDMLNQLKDEVLKDEVKNSLLLGSGYYADFYESINSGKIIPVRVLLKGIDDFTGVYTSGIGIVENVSNQKKAEKEILETNNQLKIANNKLVASTTALQNANEELVVALAKAQENEELEKANKLLRDQKIELENTLNQLKDAQMQLIQSEKMASVGILTSGIAHEINNPLNYIQGGKTAIELFIADNLSNYEDDIAPYINMIEDGINKAVEIVKSLNHFNRTSQDFNEKCKVNAILDNCIVMLNNQLKYRVELEKVYTTQDYELLGNEGRLHQLFINILQNASQAIEGNGKIIVSTHKTQTNLVVSITDTGSGISKENLDKISDPFFTTKAPGEGTGLGLSIAYNIIKEHKGSIAYESEENVGTKVIISLPINIELNAIQ